MYHKAGQAKGAAADTVGATQSKASEAAGAAQAKAGEAEDYAKSTAASAQQTGDAVTNAYTTLSHPSSSQSLEH